MEIYYRAGIRARAAELKRKVNVARVAFHADRNRYRQFMKALTIKDEKVEKMSAKQFFSFLDHKVKGNPNG